MLNRSHWFDRAYGSLIGQAVGDALGAPVEGLSVYEIRERHAWIADFISDDPAGTDDTEYAMLTARIILSYGHDLTLEHMTAEWTRYLVGQDGGFNRGGFSEMDAIYNLRKGLVAPYTGSDNHEMWSDGAAMRIAPIGIFCAGDPQEAARLAGIEARVSHHRDGVYCGQAIAASVAAAMVGKSWEAVVEAGLRYIPEDSWTHRKISEAVDIAMRVRNEEKIVEELYNRISIFYYPWADVAPEATALAYGAFVAGRGEYVPSVLCGVNVGRDADTIAAMAGAMAGALHGVQAVPVDWRDRINMIRGTCIHATAGMNVKELAEQFADVLSGRKIG